MGGTSSPLLQQFAAVHWVGHWSSGGPEGSPKSVAIAPVSHHALDPERPPVAFR